MQFVTEIEDARKAKLPPETILLVQGWCIITTFGFKVQKYLFISCFERFVSEMAKTISK